MNNPKSQPKTAAQSQNPRPNDCYSGPSHYTCEFCHKEIEWHKFGIHACELITTGQQEAAQ